MTLLALLFGALIGLSLGLTGGGGSIFAVPMLVYGLAVPAREAVGISLASVGATALLGCVGRWRTGEVELRTGLLFAGAGMVGAPVGSLIAARIPDGLLLTLFSLLMLFVAVRMWRKGARRAPAAACPPGTAGAASGAEKGGEAGGEPNPYQDQPTCRRDSHGMLLLNSRCAVLLLLVGVATGVLAGLFGVGGGFVIVPALVLFSGMSIHRAVGTSLLVIALVSVSGVTSLVLSGREIAPLITALFVAGGVAGLYVGGKLARRVSGPALQRVFASAIVAVAAFVLWKNLAGV